MELFGSGRFVPGEQGNVCSELLVALLRNSQHRAPLGTEECLAEHCHPLLMWPKTNQPIRNSLYSSKLSWAHSLGLTFLCLQRFLLSDPFCRRAGTRLSLGSGQNLGIFTGIPWRPVVLRQVPGSVGSPTFSNFSPLLNHH